MRERERERRKRERKEGERGREKGEREGERERRERERERQTEDRRALSSFSWKNALPLKRSLVCLSFRPTQGVQTALIPFPGTDIELEGHQIVCTFLFLSNVVHHAVRFFFWNVIGTL